MPAPKGHPRWGNPLNEKKYTPEEFWKGAIDYFEWCDKNPWIKIDFRGKDADRVEIPVDRPYSIEGLCNHLDIHFDTFSNYSKKEGYETYFEVCSRIRKIIDAQHFEGGMVGTFNANLSARKLGLSDKKDLTSTDGSMTPKPNIIVQSDTTKKGLDELMNG